MQHLYKIFSKGQYKTKFKEMQSFSSGNVGTFFDYVYCHCFIKCLSNTVQLLSSLTENKRNFYQTKRGSSILLDS